MASGIREVLLGPSYFHHRRLIEQSKNWTTDEIQAYQKPKFEKIVHRYGTAITDKEDYRATPQRYSRWGVPLLTHYVRTGGTSGQPLRFRADTLARRQKERAYLFDIWSRIGYTPHDLRVVFRGRILSDIVQMDRLENAWVVSPRLTTAEHVQQLRSWIRTLPPFFLHVYPSSLYPFIELVSEKLFRSLPVRGVFAGSEGFPPGQQEQFEENFGIQIAHWYGHSEYAVLAYRCRDCRGFHFYPTYGHVELVPSDTQGCQRIIATSFSGIGTQFVRYDTRDLAVTDNVDCAADNFPRVGSIVGRSQETIRDESGRRWSLLGYAFGIHGSFWDQIQDLQFVQDRPGHLIVRLVPSLEADKQLIEDTLKGRMRMIELDFEYVSAIPRTENGKRKYLVDLLEGS